MPSGNGDNKPQKRPRLYRPLRWTVFIIIILLTTANIYFHLRSTIIERALPLVTSRIEQYAETGLNGWIEWETATVDHWGRVVFENVRVGMEGDSEPTASVREITITIDESQLLSGSTNPIGAVKSILIDGCLLRLSRDADGGFNLSSLFKESEEPFDLDKFPLRCILRFENTTFEYQDPIFEENEGSMIRAVNLRGGVDLRNAWNVNTGFKFDIGEITRRDIVLDGRTNLDTGQAEFTLTGEIDLAKTTENIKHLLQGLEIDGTAGIDLHSSGNILDDPGSLLPEGEVILFDTSFDHDYFDKSFTEVQGTLDVKFSENDDSVHFTSSGDSFTFLYSDSAKGVCDVRAGWDGNWGYTLDVDLQNLDTNSVRSIIPRYVNDTLELNGTVNGSFLLFGVDREVSLQADIDPSPGIELVDLKFAAGGIRFAWHDNRALIENVLLHSSNNRSLSVAGFIDLRGGNETRLNGGFTNIPLDVSPAFYSPASKWYLDGDVSGHFTYSPVEEGHGLEMRIHSNEVTIGKYGETGPVRAEFATSRGNFDLHGLAGEIRGGWFSGLTDKDGIFKFALSDIDGSLLTDIIDEEKISAGLITCEGEYIPGMESLGLNVNFAIENPAFGELEFLSITGAFSAGIDGLSVDDLKAVSVGGGVIEASGRVPLTPDEEVDLEIELRDFDLGEFIPGRDAPLLSRTECRIQLNGPLHNMTIDASLTEHEFDLFGNLAYSCDPTAPMKFGLVKDEGPPVESIVLTGKASVIPAGLLISSNAGDFIRLSDIKLQGSIWIDKFPEGLRPPEKYRHVLIKGSEDVRQPDEGAALALKGIIDISGDLSGPINQLEGEINLSADRLSIGLEEIRNFTMSLLAGGTASLTLDGRWEHPSGGQITLAGPVRWDPDEGAVFADDLHLVIDSASIEGITSLVGIDLKPEPPEYVEGVTSAAEINLRPVASGYVEGEGLIGGRLGNLELRDFNISASKDSSLYGMKLAEGNMQFKMSGGILELEAFKLLEEERRDGGECLIEGSGELYLEEASLLPQAQISATITDYSLESYASWKGDESELNGRVDAEIKYLEQENIWRIEKVSVREMTLRDTVVPDIRAAGDINTSIGRLENIEIEITEAQGGWLKATGWVTLGVLSGLFDPDLRNDLKYTRVDLDVTGADFDLRSIDSLLPGRLTIGGSIEAADLHITGKPTNPGITGTIKSTIGPVKVGELVLFDEIRTESGEGLHFEEGILKTSGDVVIRHGQAVAGLTGDIDLRPLNPLSSTDPRYTVPENNFIRLNMLSEKPVSFSGTGFTVDIFPEGLVLEIIPARREDKDISTRSAELFVTGDLTIKSGNVDASAFRFGEAGGLEFPLTYDIDVHIDQGCRLNSGSSLRTTLTSGEVNLSGSPKVPRLGGRIDISEGELNYLSRTFTLQPGAVLSFLPYLPQWEEHPLLVNPQLRAEADLVISRHRLAEPGGEPLIITATIDAFMLSLEGGLHFTSNYPYSTDELLAILGYEEFFQTLEEEGISEAFASSLYIYPSGLLSRYVRDIAGFSRFELTVTPEEVIIVDLEREVFIDNILFTYNQAFGVDTNYTWGAKYRFGKRSYAGFLYENLVSQDKKDWVFFLQYLLPVDDL